jgi:signal transduction histidine kinase
LSRNVICRLGKVIWATISTSTPLFSEDKPITISAKRIQKNAFDNKYQCYKIGKVNIPDGKKNCDEIMIAIVSVRDRGTGIDPEILSRLFTKFTTKSNQGTGLGLYVSKSILRLMVDKYGLTTIMMVKKELRFPLVYQ